MTHRFLGGHEGPKSDLFLQYLSTGQFECARLMFQQVMREGNDESKSKLKRQAALVACGLRHAEWVPTTSAPSSAHLAWLCRRLVEDEQDIAVPVDTFQLASSSLLLEAGIDFDDHNSMPPSDKIKMTINGYLANRERLCKILQGPSHLTRIVWSKLEPHMSESDASETLSLITESLSQSNRDLDAVRLFAYSQQVIAPQVLARKVSSSDGLALQSLCVLLTAQQTTDERKDFEERIQLKHASICRFRGDSLTTVEAAILQSFRQGRSTEWLEWLINDPFRFSDAPNELRALNLLTSTSDPSWSERLFQVQDAITVKSQHGGAKTTAIGRTQQNTEQNPNDFARCLHDRVNRLGFCSIVSETLCGAADVQAARLSHNLRGKTIFEVLLHTVPSFDVEKVRDLGSKLSAGLGSIRNEQIQLNVIRCAVWLDSLKQAENELGNEEEKNSRLVDCTNLYFDGLITPNDVVETGYFWLKRGLFGMTDAPSALKVTRCIRSTTQSRLDDVKDLINSLLEAESRLEICEIAMGGDIVEAMQSSPWTIYTRCMDNREYRLAMTFSEAVGQKEWFIQARIGLELQDEYHEASLDLKDAIAKADYCIMRGVNGHVELGDPELEERVQMFMQKSRSFTPNVSEESFLASFPAKSYLESSFDKESVFASEASLRSFLRNSNSGGCGPIVSDLLHVVLDLSTTLNTTPQQVFDLGLWGSICQSALRDSNGRRISIDLMNKVGLDLRRILLLCRQEYCHHRPTEFWDALEAVEKEIPVQRATGGPILRLMFEDSNQMNNIDDDDGDEKRHYRMFNILIGRLDQSQLSLKRPHAGSEFSLDTNDDQDSSHLTTNDAAAKGKTRFDQVVQKVHNAVVHSKQKEKWLSTSIANRSCDVWSLLENIKSKRMTPQMAFEKLTTSSKRTLNDEALGEIAGLLVGLQMDESQGLLVLVESIDQIEGEKAIILLGMIVSESTKSKWLKRIVDALHQGVDSHPQLGPLFLRTIQCIDIL